MRMTTPLLRTLSEPVASPALAALWRLAVMSFCVANTPGVACACFVPGAAVPWESLWIKNCRNAIALKQTAFLSSYVPLCLSPKQRQEARVRGLNLRS